jgi:arylsulfatase
VTIALLRAVATFAVFFTASGCHPRPHRPPNVVLITIDTLRADRLGSYGYELDASPRIDALAREGVVFERAVAAAAMTAPSHASIMTSRYTRGHSIGFGNGTTRLDGLATLAEVLRDAGYATAAFVGNMVLARHTGLDRGFERYDDDLSRVVAPNVVERIAGETSARALAWLEQVGPQPFFLWLHLQDPHGPYAPPPAYAGRFRVEAPPGEQALPSLEGSRGRGGIPDYQKLAGLSRPSEYEGRYADEIFYADRHVGELLDAVDAQPSGPAIVLLTSDHGESFGEGGFYFVHGHETTPDVAHVPLILRAPGLPPGRRKDVVSHVDVMPTLLELAGLAPLPGASGVALARFVRDGEPLPDRLVYCDIGPELSAYSGGGFVRVSGLGGPWRNPKRLPRAHHGLEYVWRDDGSWSLLRADAPLDDRLRTYSRDAVAFVASPSLTPAFVQGLRALGYGE